MMEEVMGTLEDIQAAFDAYKVEVEQIFGLVDSAISGLTDTIGQLKTQLQNAGLDPAQVDALMADITGAQTEAQTRLQALQAEQPTPATGSGDQTPSGGTADPSGGVQQTPSGGAADPSGGVVGGTPDTGAQAQPGQADPSASGGLPSTTTGDTAAEPPVKPRYTFDGDPSGVDASMWPPTGLETTEAPSRLLYNYRDDQPGGPATADGMNGQWHEYTGPTQPVPTT
jgi:hypothetical protein